MSEQSSIYVCLNRGTAGGNLPFDQFVQLARDSGFPGCDVDMGYAPLKGVSALRDLFESGNRKLRYGGWGVPDWRGEASKAQEGLQQLPAQASAARELNIDHACTWIMPSSDRPFIENWNFHVERLKPVAKILADHGLRFGLEFVAPYHLRRMFKHEFIFTPALMLELADAIGPNVGLLVDCFHVHASGTSYEHLSQIPAEKIVHCHLNDCPRVAVDEIKDDQRLLPGDGAIDIGKFFGALKKSGYVGPVSLEVFNADLKKMDPLAAAKKAWSATQKVLAAAGVA
jgi:sugar phosphate isomerase/epimerase